MSEVTHHRGLAYREDGAGPALLCLHPAFTDGRAFDGQLPLWTAEHRVLRVDLPGHGASKKAVSGVAPPTMDGVAPALDSLLDELRVGRVHLVGVSLGSLVAQDIARRFPGRVESLTVLGSYEVTDPTAARARSGEMLRWLPRVLFSMPSFRRYLASVSASTEAGQARFFELSQGFTRGSFLAMQGMDKVTDGERSDPLSCPLNIELGELDLPVVREASRRWHEAQAGSRLRIHPGAGHCANLDGPEEFARSVLDFVSGLEGAP